MDEHRPREQLVAELERTRQRVAELEELEAQHRRTERALRQTAERYRIVSELATDVVYCARVEPGMEDRLLAREWTAGDFVSLTGYTLDEVDTRGGWRTLVHPDDVPIFQQRRGKILTGQTGVDEYRIITKSGATRWVRSYGRPVWDEAEGRVVRIYGARQDITDLRQAEALRESDKRFQLLFEEAPIAYQALDESGRLTEVNKTWSALVGYPEEKALGRPFAEFIAPEQRQRFAECFERLNAAGEMRDAEYEVVRSDGSRIAVLLNGTVARDELGAFKQTHCTMRDITERVRAEQSLREAEEQLRHQERLAAIGQLAGGIAHDFNNYLTVIMLGAQVSLRKPYLPPDLKRSFENALDASRRAGTLVQRLLDFSRHSLGDIKPLELGSWLKGFSYVLRHTLPENIEVSVQRQRDDCVVNADQGRIQQALMNLAINARDAMPEGGQLRIDLSRMVVHRDEKPPAPGMDSGEWICLAISDTGTGMTADARSHLFEPFFTTKEVGEGTGLSLAQVYGIVKQHNGCISVDAQPGRGTEIRIYLPAYADEPEEVAEEHPVPPRGKGETILLVEDEDKLREVGQEILEGLGYQVLTAAHGREALAVFQSAGGVDLVITDMVMPQMGGKALMRELRRQHTGQKGLIITGYAPKEHLAELKDEGIIDTVRKPFDAETLARVVRRALDED